jgi:hypothetical protein
MTNPIAAPQLFSNSNTVRGITHSNFSGKEMRNFDHKLKKIKINTIFLCMQILVYKQCQQRISVLWMCRNAGLGHLFALKRSLPVYFLRKYT